MLKLIRNYINPNGFAVWLDTATVMYPILYTGDPHYVPYTLLLIFLKSLKIAVVFWGGGGCYWEKVQKLKPGR
jgi:hypothetical protein